MQHPRTESKTYKPYTQVKKTKMLNNYTNDFANQKFIYTIANTWHTSISQINKTLLNHHANLVLYNR